MFTTCFPGGPASMLLALAAPAYESYGFDKNEFKRTILTSLSLLNDFLLSHQGPFSGSSGAINHINRFS